MRKKTSTPHGRKDVPVVEMEGVEENDDAFSELAAMAEEFGTDIDTIGEHFEKFTECGILQPEELEADLFSQEFKDAVFRKMEEVDAGEVEIVSDDTVGADEIRLMEAVGYITLEKLVDSGILNLTDEEALEQEFEKIMKSMLFLLYVSGEFDTMLERCAGKEKAKTKKHTKKPVAKKVKKGKKKR
ncbi:MAG: hypothetical protein N3F63_04665 [Thermoplasmata archaeon]|nr:hypothetical protein [Thermoplasmata archaeon]